MRPTQQLYSGPNWKVGQYVLPVLLFGAAGAGATASTAGFSSVSKEMSAAAAASTAQPGG